MLRSSRAALLATLVSLALVLAACASSSSTPAPTTAPVASTPASSPEASTPASSPEASSGGGGGGGDAVTIQNFAFAPATLEVAVGTTVTWANQDSTAHTVTADDGSFDSKSIAAGQSFSQAFTTAGTFDYHCTIHSSMKATITVK